MKRFILNFFYFSLYILLVSAAIEVSLLHKANIYSYKHQYVLNHLDDIHVLLMGNSHILYGLKPDSMGEGVFNTAISARKVYYDAGLIKQYVPKIKHLETVVMPLDYFSFYLGREVADDGGNRDISFGNTDKCMYYKYMDIPSPFWYWSELLNSKLNYMGRFVKSPEESRECDSLGCKMMKLAGRQLRWEHIALPRQVDTSIKIDIKQYDQLLQFYKEMAEITSDKHSRLILISTPLYRTYVARMNPVIKNEMYSFVAQLREDYQNIEYYDFMLDGRFKDEDFIDAGHLSELGAAKLSRILKNILSQSRKKAL